MRQDGQHVHDGSENHELFRQPRVCCLALESLACQESGVAAPDTYIHTYICIHIRTPIHIHIHRRICIHTNIFFMFCIYTKTYMYVCVCVCVHMYVYMVLYIYVCISIYIYTELYRFTYVFIHFSSEEASRDFSFAPRGSRPHPLQPGQHRCHGAQFPLMRFRVEDLRLSFPVRYYYYDYCYLSSLLPLFLLLLLLL